MLHADDFGMNVAVTAGILQAFSAGLLTSTSLLANAPACEQALTGWKTLEADREAGRLSSQAARERLDDCGSPFDLGIHLNLTQGEPLTGSRYPAELLDEQGRFPGIGRLFWRWRRGASRYRDAVWNELAAQVAVLVDHDLPPTHLNGHQYVELLPGLAEIVLRLCEKFAIPTVRVAREERLVQTTLLRGGQVTNWLLAHVKRHFASGFHDRMRSVALPHADAFFGTSHAGRIDFPTLKIFLAEPNAGKFVEIGLHPGTISSAIDSRAAVSGWGDPLADVRPNELNLLTSDALIQFLESHGWRLGRLSSLGHTKSFQDVAH
ncbi:MAG: ChbG/HpnK family deacetylase [Planctomycetales bacterium]|nr:ChbG/HpnK family deacetylase [Planctomycetales bacterium]